MNSLKSKSKTIPRAFLRTAHTSKVKFGSAHERVVLLSLLFSAIYAGSGWLSSNGFLQFVLLVSVVFFSSMILTIPCVSRNDEFVFFFSRLFVFCFCVYYVLDFLIFKHLIRLVFLYTLLLSAPFCDGFVIHVWFSVVCECICMSECVCSVYSVLCCTKKSFGYTAYCTACITLTVLLIFRCCFEVQRIQHKKNTHKHIETKHAGRKEEEKRKKKLAHSHKHSCI